MITRCLHRRRSRPFTSRWYGRTRNFSIGSTDDPPTDNYVRVIRVILPVVESRNDRRAEEGGGREVNYRSIVVVDGGVKNFERVERTNGKNRKSSLQVHSIVLSTRGLIVSRKFTH